MTSTVRRPVRGERSSHSCARHTSSTPTPGTKLSEACCQWKYLPRVSFNADHYLNNYYYSVDEMMAVDPLPALVPINPFPDPYLEADISKVEEEPKWSSGPRVTVTSLNKQERFPRRRDWMHDWAEERYRTWDGGAKTKKT